MPGELFDQLQLFQDLCPTHRELLRPLFIPCNFSTGDVIFEQGDQATNIYLVLEGEVVIRFKPEDGPVLVVARVRPEGMVGWSAALGNYAYTSSAVCSIDCQMLRVHGLDLRSLCENNPDLASLVLDRMASLITERIHSTHEHVIALLEQGMLSGVNGRS